MPAASSIGSDCGEATTTILIKKMKQEILLVLMTFYPHHSSKRELPNLLMKHKRGSGRRQSRIPDLRLPNDNLTPDSTSKKKVSSDSYAETFSERIPDPIAQDSDSTITSKVVTIKQQLTQSNSILA